MVECAGASGPGWGFVAAFCVVGGSLAVVDGEIAVGIAIIVIMGSAPSFPTSLWEVGKCIDDGSVGLVWGVSPASVVVPSGGWGWAAVSALLTSVWWGLVSIAVLH